jgi:hypothetical protein
LGIDGKWLTEQEESTTNDDAVVPYHLWDSRLTILWDGDVLPPPGVAKAAEAIQDKVALRFWEIKARKILFAVFVQRYKLYVPHQKILVWDGTKYTWTVKHNCQCAHHCRAMWGKNDNDKHKTCWQQGTTSRERPMRRGRIAMLGPGPFSGDGAMER